MAGKDLHVTQRTAGCMKSLAARVIKVRRPEWDEHPFIPSSS